jgi:antitoxin MazE
MATTRSRVIRIGNSHGVRIPKPVLDSLALKENQEVSLSVQRGKLIIQPARRPREGWDEAFALMAKRGDDKLLEPDFPPTEWEETEWTW